MIMPMRQRKAEFCRESFFGALYFQNSEYVDIKIIIKQTDDERI